MPIWKPCGKEGNTAALSAVLPKSGLGLPWLFSAPPHSPLPGQPFGCW